MKSLMLLILVWLAFQFGALLLDGRHSKSAGPHQQKPSTTSVDVALRDWPSGSRAVAKDVMHRLGPPDVVEQGLMRWERRGGVGLVLYRQEASNRLHVRNAAASETINR